MLDSGEEAARFSKELATVKYDVPIHFEVPKKEWSLNEHGASITAMCEKLEFRALSGRVNALIGTKVISSEVEAEPVAIDPVSLKETALALWIIRSDATNPGLEDILTFAKT